MNDSRCIAAIRGGVVDARCVFSCTAFCQPPPSGMVQSDTLLLWLVFYSLDIIQLVVILNIPLYIVTPYASGHLKPGDPSYLAQVNEGKAISWSMALQLLLVMIRREEEFARNPAFPKFKFFPSLSFFATAVLYLLVFEFLIIIVNCVKELGPFIDL